MPRHHHLPLPLLLLLLLFPFATCQPNEDGSIPSSEGASVPGAIRPDPRTTVFATLSDTQFGDFEVLRTLLTTLDLADNLDTPGGRVTLFAPPDDAFIALIRRIRPDLGDFEPFDTPAIIAALTESLAPFRDMEVAAFVSPRDLLAYHILNDALHFDAIEDQSPLNTSAGIPLSVVDGLIVDQDPREGVAPSIRNIFNLNGWLHVVPQVLLPFDLTNALNVIPTPTPSISASPSPTGDGSQVDESVSPTVTPTPVLLPSPEVTVPAPSEPAAPTDDADDDVDVDGTDDAAEPSESLEDEDAICFPPSARLELADGRVVTMAELQAGDHVRVHEDGRVSRVFAWTHRMRHRRAVFYELRTANAHAVRMTGGHYVYANGVLTSARAVRIGDVVRTVRGESAVVGVRAVRGSGLFAPHTMHGDLVVDGVVVSGYSRAVAPWVAHALLAPVRGLVAWAGVTEPLGAALYGGADGVARWMPSGRERY